MHKTSLHSYLGTLLDVNFEVFVVFFFQRVAFNSASRSFHLIG